MLLVEDKLFFPVQENPAVAIQGAYQYTAPDGQPIQLAYEADELGYRPVVNISFF